MRSKATKCLKKKHKVVQIKQLMIMTKRLRCGRNSSPHQGLKTCDCQDHEDDRREGCRNPNECARTAEGIINKLHPKYKPLGQELNNNNLLLMPRRLENNARAEQKDSAMIFNPLIQIKEDPGVCFWVFVDPETKCKVPATRNRAPVGRVHRSTLTKTTIYFDGAYNVWDARVDTVRCELWYGDNDERNTALCIRHDALSKK